MDSLIAAGRPRSPTRAERELEALVAISSPSGDVEGAEQAIALCTDAAARARPVIERVPCSTAGQRRRPGRDGDRARAARRLLLLGHLDTVIDHDVARAAAARRRAAVRPRHGGHEGRRRARRSASPERCADRPETFAELSVLLVTDEEWRTAQFVHARALRRLRRLPVLRGRPADARRARRGWSSAARPPGRCG